MKSTRQILKAYNSEFIKAKQIKFTSVEKQDVYNITAPIKLKNQKYILGRVESRSIEEGAKVMFFKRKKNSSDYWRPDKTCPIFSLQDPFLTKVKDLHILGGVEVKQRANKKHLSYRTVFYKGKDIHNLRRFAEGPWGMKGIRLIELPDKRIGVFTRPQGKKGGLGRIGFTILDSLKELTPRKLSRAELIPAKFAKGEWGGVNEIVVLKNNKLGILGHIARFSKDKKIRFYYPIAFCFNPETRKSSTMRLLVRRGELPEGEAKRPDLYNVVYPGGIIRNKNNTAELYAGVGDAEAYKITIQDPFTYYEENNVV